MTQEEYIKGKEESLFMTQALDHYVKKVNHDLWFVTSITCFYRPGFDKHFAFIEDKRTEQRHINHLCTSTSIILNKLKDMGIKCKFIKTHGYIRMTHNEFLKLYFLTKMKGTL